MRYALIALLTLAAHGVQAADDATYRLMKLEQDVRNLERQVQTLTRQLDEMKQRSSRAGERSPATSRAATSPATGNSGAWLDVAKWDRVLVGMTELEVIGLLGPPTSMRQDGAARVLLYAMEIGSSGFLSGSVSLRERSVSEVSKPVLK